MLEKFVGDPAKFMGHSLGCLVAVNCGPLFVTTERVVNLSIDTLCMQTETE